MVECNLHQTRLRVSCRRRVRGRKYRGIEIRNVLETSLIVSLFKHKRKTKFWRVVSELFRRNWVGYLVCGSIGANHIPLKTAII
jgi:hypothetical protein